jgi:hypothetical protein
MLTIYLLEGINLDTYDFINGTLQTGILIQFAVQYIICAVVGHGDFGYISNILQIQ